MKENVKLLVEALESGRFRQGRGFLYHPKRDAYCCLGVAEIGAEVLRVQEQGRIFWF